MKQSIFKNVVTAAIAAATLLSASAADFREHRGVYISCYVADWPSTGITASNAATHKRILTRSLDRLKAGGVNVVYFAVRPLCDAAYRSKYEPWSQCVSGTRGVEPAFDPLQFLIDEAHARGIEVYTWLNAYRYCTIYKHGESPLDYELTHPEWLLVQEHETILNPCLEEVKQRVCDVAADIVDNYDIDGFLFDDYYYTNNTPLDLDASFYEADVAAGLTSASQLQWRRDNVSDMVQRVSNVVKSHKPWVLFGIKPAGVANPPDIRDYGLEPWPSSYAEQDWQYNGVCADPIYWFSQHWCDFMAPQIYWCNLYDPLESWWNVVARKFGRHLYSAVSMSKFANYGAAEFAREAEYGRSVLADNTNGIGFFRYYFYMNEIGKIDGTVYDFPEYMGATAFATPVLAPIRPWNNVYEPAYVTNLSREGSTLSWDAVEGARYTVYAFAAGEEQRPYNTNLVQVTYTNSFTIPDDLVGKTFGVAVYDRYGNEYPMTTEGGTPAEAVIPRLTYPEDGATAADLFDFAWEDTGCDNILEVATDAAFTDIVTMAPTAASSVNSYVVNDLQDGKTYYWRVRTNGVNAPVGTSEVRSFVASRIALTGPVGDDASLNPTIAWTAAYPGADYTVELSRNADFSAITYSTTVTDVASLTLPDEANMLYGMRYYVRVTASREGRSSMADAITFQTADGVPSLPKFINPAVDGATIHANECVEVEVPAGAWSVVLNICASDDFTGGVSRTVLHQGETATKELSTIRIKGKYLVDGTTYYVRANAEYFTQANQSASTSGENVVTSFVYSSSNGVADITADDDDAPVLWYNLQGVQIAEPTAAGIYIRRQGARAVKVVID